jgi:arsenite methyltransferase
VRETPDEVAQLKTEIRERFAKLARTPHEEETFLVGPIGAKRLGYDADEIDALPVAVVESFAGVGNPLALEQRECPGAC